MTARKEVPGLGLCGVQGLPGKQGLRNKELRERWGLLGLLLGSQHFNCSALVAPWTLSERGSTIDEATICTSSNSIPGKEGLARYTSRHF